MKSSDSDVPDIIFSDNHLLIANKPAGWLTQPDGTDTPSLEIFAKNWVKQQFEKPGGVFLHRLHRLDKPVSGLVLFARTSKALSRLNEQVRDNAIQRIYIAEVEGVLAEKEGTLEHYLVHGDHRAVLSHAGDTAAKLARLRYKVMAEPQTTTLVAIELETGRYHQIRAQFSAIGHPIFGDQKYGAKRAHEEIHLHCARLCFAHPVTKEMLSFESPAPF